MDRKFAAWLAHRQGLLEQIPLSTRETLEKYGWQRSVGGSNPYLALRARAGISREDIDQAVASLAIHELPSARGCTYAVGKSDFGLALDLSIDFEGDMVAARKFGVTDSEIDDLMQAVREVVQDQPRNPQDIKKALGDQIRNLGPEAKKKGLTTTLPLALGRGQSRRLLRRVPADGRLDSQRYLYTCWPSDSFPIAQMDSKSALVELAHKFWNWNGAAKVSHFVWFSGKPLSACKEATSALHLEPLPGQPDWLSTHDAVAEYTTFERPETPAYRWISSLDSLFLSRRDITPFVPSNQLDRIKLVREKAGANLMEIPCHALVDRGEVVGLWEYDSFEKLVVLTQLRKLENIEVELNNINAYIQAELGDVRSFSLDSPESRKPLLERLRNFSSAS